MKLQLKVLIILATLWVGLSLIIFGYSRSILTADYKKLEYERMASDIGRTTESLSASLKTLKTLNTDWSQWDDMYTFMKDKNNKFIVTNMVDTTFQNAKIDFILLFKLDDTLFYGQLYNRDKKQFEPVPESLIQNLQGNKIIISPKNNVVPFDKLGFLNTTDGMLAVSSLPILPSSGKGEVAGTIVMGYYFDVFEIKGLADLTRLTITITPLSFLTKSHALYDVYSKLLSGSDYVIQPVSGDVIDGYTFVKDLNNQPIGIITVETPRTLYASGLKTINSYVLIVGCFGVIILIAIWFVLNKFVLHRIRSIAKQIVSIKQENKFERQVLIKGQDELNGMVDAINSLLSIIHLTENQLKHRISVRNEELTHLSNLNKNLYMAVENQKAIQSNMTKDDQALRKLAYYDSLTDLPNRILFNELLNNLLARAKRENSGLAILFIDIDKFKVINDTYGHLVGDKYLTHIGHRLKQSIKDSDVAARISGDEFLVCLTNITNNDEVKQTVERLLRNLSIPLTLVEGVIKASCSVGISIFPKDGYTVTELEKHADVAMYYAKKDETIAFQFYEPSLETKYIDMTHDVKRRT